MKLQLIKQRKQAISTLVLPVLKKYHVLEAGLFGSVLRDDFGLKSDIDVVIKASDNMSLLDLVGLELDMEEATGRSVDVVEYHTIVPDLKKQILESQYKIL